MTGENRANANEAAQRLVAGKDPAQVLADWEGTGAPLVALAQPIAVAAANKVGGGLYWLHDEWHRPFPRDFGKAEAFDAIVQRAVLGGRLPWRRQVRRTAKYHGWIHKREVTFSTYIWHRAQNDFRSWIKEVRYEHPERAYDEDLEKEQPRGVELVHWYDSFVYAWREDQASLIAAIQHATIPERFKHMLLYLIEHGYNFDQPRETVALFRDYAAGQGISPQKAAQRLGEARKLMRAAGY